MGCRAAARAPALLSSLCSSIALLSTSMLLYITGASGAHSCRCRLESERVENPAQGWRRSHTGSFSKAQHCIVMTSNHNQHMLLFIYEALVC